jgi:ADP-ribose pyrophosphatase YjhB (NUDIX family)
MADNKVPKWLEWARGIQALSQTGISYSVNDYDTQRYEQLIGIAAEMITEHSVHQKEEILTEFSSLKGYAAPKVDVRAAVFQDNKLLMVKEVMDETWSMPGGWADIGDLPSVAAEREVIEETGFVVKASKVIGVYDANRIPGKMDLYHAYKLVFMCELIDGEATTSFETSEVAFLEYNEIPFDNFSERTKARQIEDAFFAKNNPDVPTVFE